MERYLLWRNGRVSGPFTLEELKLSGLQSSDQLRHDKDQSLWRSIYEIEALQDWLAGNSSDAMPGEFADVNTGQLACTSNIQTEPGYKGDIKCPGSTSIGPKSKTRDPYTDYEESSLQWFIQFLRQSNPFTIATVFIGLLVGTLLLKSIVDRIIVHTFPMEHVPTNRIRSGSDSKNTENLYRNALVREWVAPVKKARTSHRNALKPQDIKNKLSLTANKFTVGFFGGISNFQLTLHNASHCFVNQVEIEVSFREKNGNMVETKTFQVESLHPLSSRVINIPPSHSGTKVGYKILNIYATQTRSMLKQS